MSKQAAERPRRSRQLQRFDEQAGVADLPSAAAAHEAPQLLLTCPSVPRRLVLEGTEGSKVTLGSEELFHGFGTQGTNQLVLEVRDADVEAEAFHLDAREVGPEAGALQSSLEVTLLADVAEAERPDVGVEQTEEPADGVRAADRRNRDAFTPEVAPNTSRQRLERDPVADPLDEHDGTKAWTSKLQHGSSVTTPPAQGLCFPSASADRPRSGDARSVHVHREGLYDFG